MSYRAYWIDTLKFEEVTGVTVDSLVDAGVMDDFTKPTDTERRLLMLLRTGDTAQRERALNQLRKLYITE